MRKLRLTAETMIAAVVLNALVFVLGWPRLGWTPTVAGVAILLVLVAFDKRQERTVGQSMAYGAVAGFVLATAALFPLTQYLSEFTSPINAIAGRPLLPAVWLVSAAAFLTADRVRNNTTPTTVRLSERHIFMEV